RCREDAAVPPLDGPGRAVLLVGQCSGPSPAAPPPRSCAGTGRHRSHLPANQTLRAPIRVRKRAGGSTPDGTRHTSAALSLLTVSTPSRTGADGGCRRTARAGGPPG